MIIVDRKSVNYTKSLQHSTEPNNNHFGHGMHTMPQISIRFLSVVVNVHLTCRLVSLCIFSHILNLKIFCKAMFCIVILRDPFP